MTGDVELTHHTEAVMTRVSSVLFIVTLSFFRSRYRLDLWWYVDVEYLITCLNDDTLILPNFVYA